MKKYICFVCKFIFEEKYSDTCPRCKTKGKIWRLKRHENLKVGYIDSSGYHAK